jgi:iron complex outermembrane recepter protein
MSRLNTRTSHPLRLAVSGVLAFFCAQAVVATEDLSQLDLTKLMSMDVVLVNAQKRTENVTEVPISMTVLKAESLERTNLDTSYDLQTVVPGLVTLPRAGVMLPYIRGVGTDNAASMEPSVSVYVDEVYQPDNAQNFVNFADVEQIEVLRGPQGTLYGRNTTGGAINITTRGPSDRFEGAAEVQTGNLNLRDGSVFVSGPLNERVRASLAAQARQKDSFYDNTAGFEDLHSENFYTLHGRLQVDLTPTLSAEILAKYLDRDDGAVTSTELSGRSVAQVYGIPVATRPFTTAIRPEQGRNRVTTFNTALKLNWRGPLVNVRSITSYNDVTQRLGYDLDGSAVALLDVEQTGGSHAITQELQFSPAREHERIDWIAGAFYMDNEVASGPTTVQTMQPTPLTIVIDGGLDTKAFAAYGEGTYKLTDAFSLTAGARYSNEYKSLVTTDIDLLGQRYNPTREARWENVSYRLVAKYKLERSTLYAKTETGFKSDLPGLRAEQYPEQIKSYEVGLKHGFSFIPAQFNAAAFFNEYQHLQLGFGDILSTAADISTPPDGQAYGIDTSLDTKLGEHWMVNLGATWLEATYHNFVSSALVPGPIAGNVAIAGVDMEGNHLGRSPEFTGNVAVSFDYPVGPGSLTGTANYYRTSRIYFEPSNLYSQPEMGLLNASLGYRAKGGWHVAAWARNLTNKAYFTSILPTQLAVLGQYGEPRTYGLSVGYSFGN